MRRLLEVKKLLGEKGIDAFLFNSQANVFYLSGFRSTHAYVFLTDKSHHLLTDGRYYERAKELLPNWDVRLIEQSALKYLKAFLKEMGAKIVGYEKDRVSCEFKEKLRTKGVRWIGFSGFLKEIRVIKNHDEIRLMEEGVGKSDLIYKRLLDFIKPGISELEVRAFITGEIFKEGGLGESFPAIVACGEGSAIPHWETSQRSIEHGKNLLIDMGLLWKGYCTDFTRTIFVGKASNEFKKVYQVVKDAHLFALERVKVGNAVGDIDKTARKYIESKGFGKFFTHSTGHGIGVEIHEYPRVYYKGPDKKRIIEEGFVFTVEPGVYIPGEFGIRLENIVAVEGGYGKPLSSISLDLVEI